MAPRGAEYWISAALSASLLVAFDTTVAGLVTAAVCLVVGKIRSNWYNNYLSALDAAMATMMEKIEGNRNDELFAEKPEPAQKPLRKKQQESSLFDYFKNETLDGTPRRTLADTLNQGGRNIEEQLESRVNAKKVDDLRTIININDKFSFMSELFHNNMKAYNDFILRLNSYTSREEALAYVAEVSAQNMWNESSLVVKNFYKVFDRKF